MTIYDVTDLRNPVVKAQVNYARLLESFHNGTITLGNLLMEEDHMILRGLATYEDLKVIHETCRA